MRYYINKLNQKIAYKYIKGKEPGVIFIHGLNSNMQGLKAKSIENYAKKNKLSFLKFDCRGHGNSFGKFENFTIVDWQKDLIEIIDNLTKGPLILIGSSMGGWLMMLAAKKRPGRIAGLIGLAAAVDFEKNLYNQLSNKNKIDLRKKGYMKYNNSGFSYILKKKFFSDAKKNNILQKPFKFNKPFILIHGLKDKVVSTKMPEIILNKTSGNNVQIQYLKSADHRLSEKKDLIIINNSINNILNLIKS